MTDTHPVGDRRNDDDTAYPGTPRWVKLVGIIAVLLVLLVVVMHLTGVAPDGHTQPVEHSVRQP